MTTYQAVPATRSSYAFGEGLRWDASSRSLLWVDLSSGRLHRAPLSDLDAVETLADLDEPLGAFAPCSSGGWLLAAGRGLSHLGRDGSVTSLVVLEPVENRMNDAACDRQGRFWVGTMAHDEREGAGSLYRVDLDGTVVGVLRDLTVGNGPAFSPDGTTIYVDDSGRQVTLAYDLDPRSGRISRQRQLIRHVEGAGDGLTVDDSGQLWVALFGGSAVHHYDADGRLLDRVEIPASQVSSCCLVEGRLFVTTVSEGLEHDEPDAGRLFVADVGAGGPAVRPYRGDVSAIGRGK
jgi:sugar lactone lactonase YvrE